MNTFTIIDIILEALVIDMRHCRRAPRIFDTLYQIETKTLKVKIRSRNIVTVGRKS